MMSDQFQIYQGNLTTMLREQVETDITIECKGGTLYAHKLVLISSSIYFQKMFGSDFQESRTNCVKFPTIRKPIMELVVDFMYFALRCLPTECRELIDLYKAAHLLDLDVLIANCAPELLRHLTCVNWLTIWCLLDECQNQFVQKDLVKFVLSHLDEIMKSDDFLEIDAEKLSSIIEEIKRTRLVATDYMMEGILKWVKHDPDRVQHFTGMATNFIYADFSKAFVEKLVKAEPLVNENAQILRMLLTQQMSKSPCRFCLNYKFIKGGMCQKCSSKLAKEQPCP